MADERRPNDKNKAETESEKTAGRSMEPGKSETWPREIGGQEGPEPTRYGDWEKGGRCTDF